MTCQLDTQLDALDMLSREYLEARCLILEVAAALDRIERGSGAQSALEDPRHGQLQDGIRILLESGTDRAEHVQELFSLPCDS